MTNSLSEYFILRHYNNVLYVFVKITCISLKQKEKKGPCSKGRILDNVVTFSELAFFGEVVLSVKIMQVNDGDYGQLLDELQYLFMSQNKWHMILTALSLLQGARNSGILCSLFIY